MKNFILFLAFAGFATGSNAQMVKDPTSWSYEAKKLSAGTYELRFRVQLKDGWHIWSVVPGGDGFQIVPQFVFAKNKGYTLKGSLKETGKLHSEVMDGIDGKVNYYSNTVLYTQLVTAASGTVIEGEQTYQVCTNELCLPPRTISFSFIMP